MKYHILISKKDPAGMNISEELAKEKIDFELIEEQSIFSEGIDKKFKADFIIFATTHSSEKETKTLTVHAPGNWRKAELGGEEGKVCPTSALFLKHIFKILNEEKEKSKIDYSVSMEATHHGPLIETPCCFIEIGSTKNQWKDKEAAKVVAKTIKRAISEKIEKAESAMGIGGPHYCPNFNKIQLNSDYAVGHVIAEYNKPFDEKMIKEALEKTQEDVKKVILDWKGCGISEERQKLIKVLEKMNLEVLRSDRVEK